MCHYVTATLPPRAAVTEIRTLAARYQRRLEPLDNPHVNSQLQPREQHFLTTWGHCDCGTVLGSLSHDPAPTPDKSAIKIERLRKRGWSESKIRRWAHQREHVAARNKRVREHEAGLSGNQAEHWLAFITAVLNSGHTPALGLLLHHYSGLISGERVTLVGRQVHRLKAVGPTDLLQMREDLLYEFRL